MEFVLKISEPKPRPWASKNSHSKEQEMKIILSNSIFQPQKQGEAEIEDYVTDCIEASSISLLLSLYLLKWSRRFVLSDVLSEDSQAESAIFQESVHQASSPNVRSMPNSEEKPNCSRWSHSLKIHQVHLEVVKSSKIKAEAKAPNED